MHAPTWLDKNRDVGVLLLRLFVAVRLIYGVQDNIVSWEQMKEFEVFLDKFNFPFPLASAVVSVYAQALAGVMILLGWKIRIAALLMIINFIVAVVMVHRNDSFEGRTPALFMLFSSLLFLFHGAGKLSLDGYFSQKF